MVRRCAGEKNIFTAQQLFSRPLSSDRIKRSGSPITIRASIIRVVTYPNSLLPDTKYFIKSVHTKIANRLKKMKRMMPTMWIFL